MFIFFDHSLHTYVHSYLLTTGINIKLGERKENDDDDDDDDVYVNFKVIDDAPRPSRFQSITISQDVNVTKDLCKYLYETLSPPPKN